MDKNYVTFDKTAVKIGMEGKIWGLEVTVSKGRRRASFYQDSAKGIIKYGFNGNIRNCAD